MPTRIRRSGDSASLLPAQTLHGTPKCAYELRKSGQSGYLFPVLSDFWPHGAVAQAYGVFNADAGIANRGTFVVDRGGTVRFAEMKQPGEQRDRAVWHQALKGVQ